MSNLTVGAGKQFSTIAAAVAASHDGDVIAVDAGTYTNDFATISTKITITGVGGLAHLVATQQPPNGKGIFVTAADVTIDHLEFSGAAVPDGNGAGIRYASGNLTITDSYFHDNQDGLLAQDSLTGSITIRNSEFSHNGTGDGFTHNLYVGDVGTLTITGSYFHDAVVGHEIKSRAEITNISDTRIFDGTGTASYSVDLPNGGAVSLSNDIIEQGPNSQNPTIVSFGEEGNLHSGTSLQITGSTILNDLASAGAKLLVNAAAVTAGISGNSVFGLTSGQYAQGSAAVSNMTTLSSEPALNTHSPWKTSLQDFGADSKADLLWRNDNGGVSTWDMNDHTFTGFDLGGVPTSWHIAGKGDFNGDGRADIVWRNDNGGVSTWDMNGHAFTGFDFTASAGLVPTSWHIVGTGDFNGDGKSDILWRNDNGAVSTWDMNDHTFTGFDFTASAGLVPTSWKVAGTGDFNGDGKTDILWRNDNGAVSTWTMNDHTFVGANFGAVPTSWHIVGTGDFNGDGKTDILWHNDNGAVSTWDMNDQTFTGFDFTATAGLVPTSWQVANTGDFNGDGKTDIVWRNTNGAVSTWDMNDHTFTGFDFTASAGAVPTSWHIS